MSKNTQTTKELIDFVANETHCDRSLSKIFINELFSIIGHELINKSSVKVEGFASFRVLRSGESKRILYIPSKDSVLNQSYINVKKTISEGTNVDKTKSDSIDGNGLENSNPELETKLPEKIQDNVNEPVNSEIHGSSTVYENLNNDLEVDNTYDLSQTQTIILPIDTPNTEQTQTSKFDESKPHQNRTKWVRIFAAVIVIILSISIIYLLALKTEDKDKIAFKEVQNTDSLTYYKIIIPQADVTFQQISEHYYGDEAYWPYLFMANKDTSTKDFVIRGGSVIRIPRVNVDLSDLQNGEAKKSAENLARDIIVLRNFSNK